MEDKTVVAALFAIAESLAGVAHAIHRLGNAEAMTSMGGLEAHGVAMIEAATTIAAALEKE
jgi:hypothetical protein